MMKYNKSTIYLAYKTGVLPRLRKQMIIAEIRKVYDADDELAIIRQKDTKPEEYAIYFSYVENCKARVNEYINNILNITGN